MVLSRRPDHRRAADVDLLDRILERHVGLEDGVDERVEVAAHEVDLPQIVLDERLDVLRLVAPGQDARVDARVQGLDTPVHHLGETREVADRPRVQGCVLDRLQRGPGREELVAQALQAAGKCGQPCLVANR